MNTKVILVEDNAYFADIIAKYLKIHNIEVIQTICGFDNAEKIIVDNPVDFLIIDIHLTKECNAEGIEIIKKVHGKIAANIIVMTSYYDKSLIMKAFNYGADAYELKCNFNNITTIIRNIKDNIYPIGVLIDEYKREREKSFISQFTEAEKQIITFFAEGISQQDIVERTLKSENTIECQIKSIKKKLNVSSIVEIIKKINENMLRKIYKQ